MLFKLPLTEAAAARRLISVRRSELTGSDLLGQVVPEPGRAANLSVLPAGAKLETKKAGPNRRGHDVSISELKMSTKSL